MLHVGLDIHTKRISICALDENGQVVHRSYARDTGRLFIVAVHGRKEASR